MAKAPATPSREILEAALNGLEAQREKLDEQIAQVRSMMGSRGASQARKTTSHAGGSSSSRSKRVLSAEARKRIAAAQKKRWAAFRKAHQQ